MHASYEKGKFDELIEDKGVKILIDPKALMHVIGTKMDFVDDKLRVLMNDFLGVDNANEIWSALVRVNTQQVIGKVRALFNPCSLYHKRHQQFTIDSLVDRSTSSDFMCFTVSITHQSEFIFINPNSKGQCGCGESFMTTSSTEAAKAGGSS
ncbi:hypothetical protein CTI12_AA374360 [Artemisia annua]|uniref:Uncharacterized protein n=1 Tax=Artemisia annua TaxID=35608 RepID=A0A2U1M908_ARTAN|nr:hypothetical protein CTI12_AA374360 [Artemisia annua]